MSCLTSKPSGLSTVQYREWRTCIHFILTTYRFISVADYSVYLPQLRVSSVPVIHLWALGTALWMRGCRHSLEVCSLSVWCMTLIPALRSVRRKACCKIKAKQGHIVRPCVGIYIDCTLYRLWNHLSKNSPGMSAKEFLDEVNWGRTVPWNVDGPIPWPGIPGCIQRRKLTER